jgi:hypothetical protein
MADPRQRITEGLKNMALPPPPARTPTTPPAAATPPATGEHPDLPTSAGGTGPEPDRPKAGQRRPTRERSPAKDTARPTNDKLPGRQVGNKRSLVAHLPARVRDALDQEVAADRTTKGVLIMRALREGHARLTDQPGPAAGTPAGPFPPERRVRRRLAVPHRVPTTYTVWPDECEALQHVAEDLDMNLSELVTDALALRYHLDLDQTTT